MWHIIKNFREYDIISFGLRFMGCVMLSGLLLECIYKPIVSGGALIGGLIISIWITWCDLKARTKAIDAEIEAFNDGKERLEGK